MSRVQSVVVIGTANISKEVLAQGLDNPEYHGRVAVPRLYTTSAPGTNDPEVPHAISLATSDFEARVTSRHISPRWKYTMGRARNDMYGFAVIEQSEEPILPVYLASIAFMRDRNASVSEVLRKSIVVAIMTSPYAEAGITVPDMTPIEVNARLQDYSADMMDSVPEVIDTTNLDEQGSQQALQAIVDQVLDCA